MQYLTPLLFHYFLLWLYSVLRANDSSTLPSSTPTSTAATTPESKSNIVVPLAIGLTLGLLIPALAVIGTFYLRRRILERRGRRKATHTLPEKGDQLSGAPQESKRQPQHTQSPTHGSTLSSSAPTTAAIPTTAISIPGSGLTFPVGGSSRSGEVAKTDQATPMEVIEILDEDDEQVDERPRPPPWWDVSQSRGTQR